MGSFRQNDPRGEYWLYSEGELTVDVGRGGIEGVCHFNTSDVHLVSGGPLDHSKVTEILALLMTQFGDTKGGYKKLLLHRNGKYELSDEDVRRINDVLSEIGFALKSRPDSRDMLWARK
jgi:hypothetical protein